MNAELNRLMELRKAVADEMANAPHYGTEWMDDRILAITRLNAQIGQMMLHRVNRAKQPA